MLLIESQCQPFSVARDKVTAGLAAMLMCEVKQSVWLVSLVGSVVLSIGVLSLGFGITVWVDQLWMVGTNCTDVFVCMFVCVCVCVCV